MKAQLVGHLISLTLHLARLTLPPLSMSREHALVPAHTLGCVVTKCTTLHLILKEHMEMQLCKAELYRCGLSQVW